MATNTLAHLTAFSSMLARDEETAKLNLRDLQIVALLVAHKTPLTFGTIATMLSLSPSHVSRVGEKLVAAGFVVRRRADAEENPADRRVVMLEATATGIALDVRVRKHFRAAAPKTAA